MSETLSSTIHDLARFVDAHPENVEACMELGRLKRERLVAFESLVESQAVELSERVSEQLRAEDSPLSLSVQYRGACVLYQSIMSLLRRNRALKARLRLALAERKEVKVYG